MNDQDKAEFDRIVALDPESMSLHDMQVLQARRDYLTGRQKQIFESVLKRKLTVTEDTATPSESKSTKTETDKTDTTSKVPGE